ncbi:MAG TPA: hypothetical protein VGF69_00665 [Thermoanaerobaculia bacterium]|jgi:hypothetical protein
MQTKLLVLLVSLFLSVTAAAQTPDYDTEKPQPSSCNEPLPYEAELPPPPEFDEPINDRAPELGFYPPRAGTLQDQKAAGETCYWDDVPMEDDYEKRDTAEDEQARLAMPCAFPASLTVQAGVPDNFAAPQDAASPSAAITDVLGLIPAWDGFDGPGFNSRFGHTFKPSFLLEAHYQSGLLTIHIRPSGDFPNNDTISLWVTDGSGVNLPGWGATISNLAPLTPGRETTLQLDLRTLATTGGSTILRDLNRWGNLNVYIQDDVTIDDMTLKLACTDSATPAPLVGVIPNRAGGCGPSSKQYEIYLDNEDRKNANARGGWLGGIRSTNNTLFRVCAVDGRDFTNAVKAGANFAVLALTASCPDGFTRFDRHHDNEDNRTESFDTAPSGSPTGTVGRQANTNMAFCVATGISNAPNSAFPDLGFEYGVWGGSDARRTPWAWALARGWLYLDDEDNRNANQPASGPAYTNSFVELGNNTRYHVSRVK